MNKSVSTRFRSRSDRTVPAAALLFFLLPALALAAAPALFDPELKTPRIDQDACATAKAQLKSRCHHRHVELTLEARRILTDFPPEVQAELAFLNERAARAKEHFKIKDIKGNPEFSALHFDATDFVQKQSRSEAWLALSDRLNNRNFELVFHLDNDLLSIRLRDRETNAAVVIHPDGHQIESEPWSEEYLTRRLPPECRSLPKILDLLNSSGQGIDPRAH